MSKIERIDENNKQKILSILKQDIVKHVFAYYDLQHEAEKTTVYASFKNSELEGYILIFTALEYPSVILECKSNLARELMKYAREKHFIMHTYPTLLQTVKATFPDAKHYVEDWMMVERAEAHFFKSPLVRRLFTHEDASKLSALLSTRTDRPAVVEKRFVELVTKTPVYGVLVNSELVAYAGSFIQLPEVWMIGGVYTRPDHRNKGYATLATSAVTQEALKHAEKAALFVRSDNAPAVKAYEKIGYVKIGEKLWVDVGTGLKP
jgi:RimJ/RimL family protein N-acetyltransferase